MRGASVFLTLTGPLLFAPNPTCGQPATKLEFDVASVRASVIQQPSPRTVRLCSTPTNCEKLPSRIQGGPDTSDPERMTINGLTLQGFSSPHSQPLGTSSPCRTRFRKGC